MNALIITGEFGRGHISAAEAIRQQLESDGRAGRIEITDIIRFLFPRLSGAIYTCFNSMAGHCSKLYNILNRIDEDSTSQPMKTIFNKKFQTLVDRCHPDVIISTWPIGAGYIGSYKTMTGCRIPYIICVTDILPHREWISPGADAYLVGDEITKRELVEKGVDPSIVFVGGIPVRKDFCRTAEPDEASAGRAGGGEKNLLFMGGGLGLMPGVEDLLSQLNGMPGVNLTVITGRNQKLYSRLKEEYPDAEVVGYVESPAKYLERADWVVTKAGGLTTFEAVAMETPMLVIPPFLEQEMENTEFVSQRGLGVLLDKDPSKRGRQIREILADPAAAAAVSERMREVKRGFAGNGIADIVQKLTETRVMTGEMYHDEENTDGGCLRGCGLFTDSNRVHTLGKCV